MRILLATVCLLIASGSSKADGCKYSVNGNFVPEHEQRAWIEWADGVETLHVATVSEATKDGSVWIVPIRATAPLIQAEPVDALPAISFYTSVKQQAIADMRHWIHIAAMLDSAGLACPFVFSGCGSYLTGHPDEASRVEKSGMIVTVVSAESRAKLQAYLDSNGVNHGQADLSPLQPYFAKPEFAFVCGWVASRNQPVTATGMKIVFPSPSIWFPLQATRANPVSVNTVVFVRGFVKPVDNCVLPGLRCDYIYAHLKTGEVSVPATRVSLDVDPKNWDRDLELTPGTTHVGTVCMFVINWGEPFAGVFSILVGALLGLFIPWLTVPGLNRTRKDWLAGAFIGGVILYSALASFLAFSTWRWKRFSADERQPRRWLLVPALALAHFAIIYGICNGLIYWIDNAS